LSDGRSRERTQHAEWPGGAPTKMRNSDRDRHPVRAGCAKC
jgi:hypothetical protein